MLFKKREEIDVVSDNPCYSFGFGSCCLCKMPKYSTGGLYTINNSDDWVFVES